MLLHFVDGSEFEETVTFTGNVPRVVEKQMVSQGMRLTPQRM
jgi:hypothetical protein